MEQGEHRIAASSMGEDWGKRRASLRHEVSLDALAVDPKCGNIECRINDLSASGMALSTELFAPAPGAEPLKPGVDIKLKFTPGEAQPAVAAAATVMWRTPTAFGLKFKDIDGPLNEALRSIARSAVESRLGESTQNRREMTAEQRKIIRDCRRTLQKLVPNIIWTLRTDLAAQLRTAAQTADAAVKLALSQDAERIDQESANIGRAIEHEFLQGFADATDMDETQELSLALIAAASTDTRAGDASLEDEREVKDQAIITALGHSAEERFKVVYFELDVRLANIVGHALNREVNSLAPAVACKILWKGITRSHDSAGVQTYLRKAMQNRTIPLLGELYDALHKTLDEAGADSYFDLNNG